MYKQIHGEKIFQITDACSHFRSLDSRCDVRKREHEFLSSKQFSRFCVQSREYGTRDELLVLAPERFTIINISIASNILSMYLANSLNE